MKGRGKSWKVMEKSWKSWKGRGKSWKGRGKSWKGRGKVVEGALLLCDEYALYGCKPCRLFLCARTLMCRDSICRRVLSACAFIIHVYPRS